MPDGERSVIRSCRQRESNAHSTQPSRRAATQFQAGSASSSGAIGNRGRSAASDGRAPRHDAWSPRGVCDERRSVVGSTAMSSNPPELPPHLRPFVLPHETVEPARSGKLDLYLPASTPAPAVLMVHGGPVPRHHFVRPPQWPTYRGYGALLGPGRTCRWDVGEHGFVDARETLRANAGEHSRTRPPRFELVDASIRTGSGCGTSAAGGIFMGSVLADPASWGVAAVAGTYAAPAYPGCRRCSSSASHHHRRAQRHSPPAGHARARLRVDRHRESHGTARAVCGRATARST